MKKTVILKASERMGAFAQPFRRSEYENISLITIKNRQRALRKLVKRLNDENVIINHFQVKERIFSNRLKIYNEFSYKTVLPIINKICRQIAAKYTMQIPFEEICIVARPEVAYSFIIPLLGISRLFTIVSDESVGKKADELYFEHGCIIRQASALDNTISRDRIIIRARDKMIPTNAEIPIIDVTNVPVYGKTVIQARSILVFDERILTIGEHWGGSGGLLLYDLLGELPDKNSKVDINKQADRIFLLDIDKF